LLQVTMLMYVQTSILQVMQQQLTKAAAVNQNNN
jgi:hypothetical protein